MVVAGSEDHVGTDIFRSKILQSYKVTNFINLISRALISGDAFLAWVVACEAEKIVSSWAISCPGALFLC
jgi:hypothetical protein